MGGLICSPSNTCRSEVEYPEDITGLTFKDRFKEGVVNLSLFLILSDVEGKSNSLLRNILNAN